MTAAELSQIMKEQSWTQRDLARLLPLRTPTSTRIIRYWLSGEKPIRPLVANRILSLATEAKQS